MAVNGFTVADLLSRLNMRMRRHAANIPQKHKIEALDEGQSQMWREVVRRRRGWFVDEATVTINPTDFEYALPDECFSIYNIEGPDGARYFNFHFSPMSEHQFQEARRKNEPTESATADYYYDVVGQNPMLLVMANRIPVNATPMGLAVKYVRMLDRLTALNQTIDDTVWPFAGAVVNAAAALLTAGVGGELAGAFAQAFANDMDSIGDVANRNDAGVTLVSGGPESVSPERSSLYGGL